MSDKRIQIGVVLVLVSMLWTGATAQTSCTSTLVSLQPCLDYIMGNSSTPSSGCCTQLATVVRGQPRCLCEVINGRTPTLGITINQTQALALPGSCNIRTPSATLCNADSPSGSPHHPGSGSSDASSIKFGVSMLFSLVFVALYA